MKEIQMPTTTIKDDEVVNTSKAFTPEMILALIDLMFIGKDSGTDIPS